MFNKIGEITMNNNNETDFLDIIEHIESTDVSDEISTLLHDLMSPLQTIYSYTELLLDDLKDDPAANTLNLIIDKVRGANEIIKQIRILNKGKI